MNQLLKVKVLKAGKPSYWYNNYIGEEFIVEDYNNIDYRVLEGKEAKNYIGKDDCELVEDFILPEKWCIKATEENINILDEWRQKQIDYTPGYLFSVGDYLVSKHHRDNSYVNWNRNRMHIDFPEYTEITFDQFKKYVLKQETNMEKEIIGYKLKKDYLNNINVKNALDAIFGEKWWTTNSKENFDTNGWHFKVNNPNEGCTGKAKSAGVLDLWFEPVYEDEYEVGDWVITKGYSSTYDGKPLKIIRINHPYCYFECISEPKAKINRHNFGTYQIVRKATPEEIKSAEKIMIGDYEVKFESSTRIGINGVYYNSIQLHTLRDLMNQGQIKSLNVGCSGQYKVDINLLNRIIEKLYK